MNRNLKYTNPVLNPNQSFPFTSKTLRDTKNSQSMPEYDNSINLASLSAAYSDVAGMASTAQQVINIYVKTQLLAQYGNRPMGFMNHTSWVPQHLPLISQQRTAWDENQFVPFIPVSTEDSPVWVDLVINNLDDGAHPFHLHGHSFYILSSFRSEGRSGWGSYNPFAVDGSGPPAGLDLVHPLRKDTVSVPRRGHVVIRFKAGNQGLWMLHCHMLVHLGSGMAMGLHVGPTGDEENVIGMEKTATALC